jgi:hypothetical protein
MYLRLFFCMRQIKDDISSASALRASGGLVGINKYIHPADIIAPRSPVMHICHMAKIGQF